ncbi:MAG: DUF2868 domain-containing protein [Casimicrobiaceae bacterium]
MNERTARDVVLVRAIETADGAREIWSDSDRVWAGRAAAEMVGEGALDAAFLGHRATLVLARLAERFPKLHALSRVPSARGWLAPVAAVTAFVIGATGVDIGPGHRINLLAPPVLALLVWNLAVYATLLIAGIAPHHRSNASTQGPVRRTVVTWLRDGTRPLRKSIAPLPLVAAFGRFASDWSALAMPLWQQRAARLLHFCAAALAAGAIAGLYIRGIALEYRAGWQSTFLDAGDVARLLHVVLAPGSWLTAIAVPAADHLQTIAGGSAGENAAPWIHLYAATILLIVIIPRLALAGIAWIRERRLARRFPIALEPSYFQRLLHAWREGTAHVIALPYSFDVPAADREGLTKLMARVFQSAVEIAWEASISYGDDELPDLPASSLAGVVAVFNLSATPERENHGAFVGALAARAAGRAPLIALVDTSDFIDRFHDQPRRIADRQASWQQALQAQGIEPLFVRLGAPDLREAGAALASRFERATE